MRGDSAWCEGCIDPVTVGATLLAIPTGVNKDAWKPTVSRDYEWRVSASGVDRIFYRAALLVHHYAGRYPRY